MNDLFNAPVFDELYTTEMVKRCHAMLLETFLWLNHATPFENLEGIRANGLTPQDPGAIYIPTALIKMYGNPRAFICLSPLEHGRKWQHIIKTDSSSGKMLLAVPSASISENIALDYSFREPWFEFARDTPINQSAFLPRAFINAVSKSGVVITFLPIMPEHIRVKTNLAILENPNTWPLLLDASDDEIEIITK